MVGFLYAIAIIILKFIPKSNSTAKIQFYSLIASIFGAVILLAITFDNKFIQSYKDLLMLVSIGILGGAAGILFIYSNLQSNHHPLEFFVATNIFPKHLLKLLRQLKFCNGEGVSY